MKSSKRIISFILLTFMTLSFFCACGEQAEPEIVPDYSTDLGEITFMGTDFIFMQSNGEHSTGEDYFGYVIDTEFADLAMERVKEVESKYDFKINIITLISFNKESITYLYTLMQITIIIIHY